MAANNYFGFTHGGTQYRASSIVLSAQPTSAYPAAQTAYVQPTHQTAYAAAAPRAAQTYDSYQTTPAPGQYAYATRTQPTATYDTSKAYYAPPAAAPTGTATAVYTVAETPYQTAFTPAAKPAYSSPSYTTAAQPRQTTTAKTQNTAPASTTNYVYQNATTTAPASSTYASTTDANTYSGSYDAALYSAATTYYQQQQAAKTGTTWQYKKGQPAKPKQKQAPKQPQLHYCEVCKISCAGPQTYREHLEGQKHKKKEAALKSGGTAATGRGQNQLRCELCDVSCTGADAYAAHIRGAKHQKVLKLHTKLGKPIPSTDPVVVASNTVTTSVASSKTAVSTASAPKQTNKASTAPITQTSTAPKKVISTPKITFVGGSQLKTTGNKAEEVRTAEQKQAELAAQILQEDKEDAKLALVSGEKDVQPVGQEYIEEVKNEAGKTVSFNCKLCECKFNDPNAKEMHMKGRRHRLQYKKKVDPSLQVEVKPSIRARKLQEEKLRRQAAKEEYWRRRDAEERWREEMRMEEEQYYMGRGFGGRGGIPPFGPGMSGPAGPGPMGGMPVRRPDTSDDRHVMAKHASIYPNETELQAVQNIVSSCEKALKLVSDFIAEIDAPKPSESDKIKKEVEEPTTDGEDGEKKEEPQAPPRALKGVMRVGVLAKGLLLHNDLNVQLVLLCSEKPTRTQLERIADSLPKHLAAVSEDTFDVKISVEEAAVVVTSDKDPKTTCTITLTSPVMREENELSGGNHGVTGSYQLQGVALKRPPGIR